MRLESLRELQGQFPDIDGVWNFSDLSSTETSLRRQLPPDDGREWSTGAAEALTQLARLQGLRGELSEAQTILEQAKKIIFSMNEVVRTRAEIRWNLEYGRWMCLSMRPSKATPFFLEAWELARRSDRIFFAIDAAVMIAISQPRQTQKEWLLRALQLAENTPTEHARLWLPQLYVMRGWTDFDMRRFEEALENFNRSLACARVEGDNCKVMITRWAVGRTLRALARVPEAFDVQQNLFNEMRVNGQQNGHVDLEMAECLQLMDRLSEARPYFESAHKLLETDQFYMDNHSSELARMQKLSKKN